LIGVDEEIVGVMTTGYRLARLRDDDSMSVKNGFGSLCKGGGRDEAEKECTPGKHRDCKATFHSLTPVSGRLYAVGNHDLSISEMQVRNRALSAVWRNHLHIES
jgi:hypothetical protein